MGVSTASGYCPYCREKVMLACTTGAVLLHLVLTLLTGGLWAVVWLHARFLAPHCVCCQCGRRMSRLRGRTARYPDTTAPWPFDPGVRGNTEFNSILVARNLVYYVPTRARYGGA